VCVVDQSDSHCAVPYCTCCAVQCRTVLCCAVQWQCDIRSVSAECRVVWCGVSTVQYSALR
jgi:hypothetical protein